MRIPSFDSSHNARAPVPGTAVEDETAVRGDAHRVTATARADHDDVPDFVGDDPGEQPAAQGGNGHANPGRRDVRCLLGPQKRSEL